MFNYNSDSDESLKNMKLDLIKAKYAHQKLKSVNFKKFSQLQSKQLETDQNLNFKENASYERDLNDPTFNRSLHASSRKSDFEQNEDRSKQFDEDMDDDDNIEIEQEDISKINDYVEYLLSKKRISMDEPMIASDFNLISTPMFQGITCPSNNGYASTEAYRRMSPNYNNDAINMQPTDILAQWRLRRKMNEAQNFVKMEHQRHFNRIHSLKSQAVDDSHFFNVPRPYPFVQQQLAIVPNSITLRVDEEPVRDIDQNIQPLTVVEKPKLLSKSDFACQCQLRHPTKTTKNRLLKLNKKFKETENAKNIKATENKFENKIKSVGIQTEYFEKDSASSVFPVSQIKLDTSADWDSKTSFTDHIDLAIEKTLQSKLLERNYSPAMSTVTSINESQHIEEITQNNSQIFCSGDNYKNQVNLDANCEKLPWNENFQIDSDNEFQFDDVLIDLRRRRKLNLEKLQILTEEIQNCKARYLSTIDSC